MDLMALVLDVTDSRQFLAVTLRVSGGLVGFVEVGEAAASRALTHVEYGIVPRVDQQVDVVTEVLLNTRSPSHE